MKLQPFCNVLLAGVSLTEFGLVIPSPFTSLQLNNSEIASATSFTLSCVIGGDARRQANVAAFETLLYGAAQAANKYTHASGIPVSFAFGWLNTDGSVAEYISYRGFTIKFTVSTDGLYMIYRITGIASLVVQNSMPALRIPELCGFVQPSAVFEAVALATKATTYYELDIDHNDAPTLVHHGPLNIGFNAYVRGSYTGVDDYDQFPGLLKLSKSYNTSREAAGLSHDVQSLSQVMNNVSITPLSNFLVPSITDYTPQCASFSYWVDSPTMTKPGIIHYKSNAVVANMHLSDILEFGTAHTNIFSIDGSYNGVAYNMTNFDFSQVGFVLDGSGNTIVQDTQVVNSWSSNLTDVFQTANIINDVNAIASQFSGEFTIKMSGSTKQFRVAQPVSLLVMVGNTISPISGVYNIISVTHDISATFITTLKLQRLVMSSANQVASGQGIQVNGSSKYASSTYHTTSNIISTGKVDFGTIYPTFEDIILA